MVVFFFSFSGVVAVDVEGAKTVRGAHAVCMHPKDGMSECLVCVGRRWMRVHKLVFSLLIGRSIGSLMLPVRK